MVSPTITLRREQNVRTGFFEPAQFEAVRRVLPPHLRPLVTFMYLTGWRRGEGTGLEWRHVDFAAGEIRLDRTRRSVFERYNIVSSGDLRDAARKRRSPRAPIPAQQP